MVVVGSGHRVPESHQRTFRTAEMGQMRSKDDGLQFGC